MHKILVKDKDILNYTKRWSIPVNSGTGILLLDDEGQGKNTLYYKAGSHWVFSRTGHRWVTKEHWPELNNHAGEFLEKTEKKINNSWYPLAQ